MKDNEIFKEAVNQIARSINYISEQKDLGNTKIYNGMILSLSGKTANIRVNGKTYSITQYGEFTHGVNEIVKVIVPQGNMNLAFFI